MMAMSTSESGRKKRKRLTKKSYKKAPLNDDLEASVRFIPGDATSDSDTEYKRDGTTVTSRPRKNGGKCTRLETQLCALLVVCIIFVAALSVLLVLQPIYLKSLQQSCNGSHCIQVAARILKRMDLKADPCQDFYQYACGGWMKEVMIPADRPRWNTMAEMADLTLHKLNKLLSESHNTNSTAERKTFDYFRSCLDQNAADARGVKPLQDLVKTVGAWPVTTGSPSGSWDVNTWSEKETILLLAQYGVNTFFDVGVEVDDKDSNKSIIVVMQSGLSFGSELNYLNDTNSKHKEAFLKLFQTVAMEMGATDKAKVAKVAEEMWNFEHKLATFYKPQVELRNVKKSYNKITIKDANELFGNVLDFREFLTKLMKRNIAPTEPILVPTAQFISNTAKMVTAVPKETLANYIVWRLVLRFIPFLTTSLRQAVVQFDAVDTGVTTMTPQWKICVSRTETFFENAVGALYAKKYFSLEDRKEVLELTTRLIKAFEDNMPNVKWMDQETGKNAIIKAKAITKKIGYPDMVMDSVKVDKYYSQLEVGNATFENAVNLMKFFVHKNLKKLGRPPDRKKWDMPSTEVNAYYMPNYNEITFPAGMLQPPYFDSQASNAINFGAIGFVIGHELNHAFDNNGRLYDAAGNLRDWWSNTTAAAFVQRADCIKDQYQQFTVQGLHVPGKLTLGENLADNGGLKASYSAYDDWLTSLSSEQAHKVRDWRLPGLDLNHKQLFFTAFAQGWCAFSRPAYARQSLKIDVHSPEKWRVIGTLQNSNEFAEAFNCPAKSPMNPAKKCHVW